MSGRGTVEFVSYDGAWPCLCGGTLVLRVNGEQFTLPYALCSGGRVYFSEDMTDAFVEQGPWSIRDLPEELLPYREAIESCVNENVEPGCCGGCI